MLRSFLFTSVGIAFVAACGGGGSRVAGSTDAGLDATGEGAAPLEAGVPPTDGGAGEVSPEGGAGGDASPDAPSGDDSGFAPGTPIAAPPGQWTWVPFANAFCGNGAATGIGINPSATGTRVLIYLEGGGACWDASTCYTQMTAAYFTTGYTQDTFDAEVADAAYIGLPGGFFDRTAPANPFRGYSFVYVPYCTGDVFSGNNVTQLGANTAHFVGHANVTAFLERIVPTFPTADRIILAGSSAGGYGAMHNWWQTQNAFGNVRVDVLDDSGTLLPPDVLPAGSTLQAQQASAWNLAATVPPCAACATDASATYGFYAKQYPTHRGGLLSYSMDSVLPSFYGITSAQFTKGLDELLADQFQPNPNLQAFVFGGAGHVLFFSPLLTQNGVTVQAFVTQMVTDSASWSTVQP